MAIDADHIEEFDDLDEAREWASEAAEATGLPYVVLAVSEDACAAAPAEAGQRGVLAAFDADGAEEPALEEAVIQRRAFDTRLKAKRKGLTTMDANRRRVARNAKNWRLRNKGRAKRYGSLYHGPKSKVPEAALDAEPCWHDVLVDAETGEVIREATDAEVRAAIAADRPVAVDGRAVVAERRRRRAKAPAAPAAAKTDPVPTGAFEPHQGMNSLAAAISGAGDYNEAVSRRVLAWLEEGATHVYVHKDAQPGHHASHENLAAVHGGTYSGMDHHDGAPHRTYRFADKGRAQAFHAALKAKHGVTGVVKE